MPYNMVRRKHAYKSALLLLTSICAETMGAHLIARFPEEVGCAELTFEETSRYAVDAPEAHAEWTMLWPSWSHAGFVRLGPAHRKLQVAMYHELHCVHVLANALARTMGAD